MFGIARANRSRKDGNGTQHSAPQADNDANALPVCPESRHDRSRNAYFAKGQFLARQDRWDMLGRLIAETDRNRVFTPAGEALAAVLAVGARDDAVRHARGAITDPTSPLPGGIAALAEVAAEMPGSWAVTLVAARAQIDCAWAYEGQVDPYALQFGVTEAFIERFTVATELLLQAEETAPDSVEIAAAKCDLLAAVPEADTLVDALHRDVVALDPRNPGRLRSYGVHLLPRWYGSYSHLSDMADDMADALRAEWGDRAYAWMCFDALRLDPEAGGALDADRFVAGLNAILTFNADPHLANLVTAYVDSMKPAEDPEDISSSARATRRRIHAALPDLADRHLTELHPQVWARADSLPGATHMGPLSSGRIAAATAQARNAVDAAVAARVLAGSTAVGRRA